MRLIDRIILMLHMLISLAFAVALIVISSGMVPVDQMTPWLALLPGRWELVLGGAVFFALSIRLLFTAVGDKKTRQLIVTKSDDGIVTVQLDALEALIEMMARQTRGVKRVRVRLELVEEKLQVNMRLDVTPECSLPDASRWLKERAREQFMHIVGIELGRFDLSVRGISTEDKQKNRVE